MQTKRPAAGYMPRNAQHYAYRLKEMRGLAAGHRFNVERS
jgi:hypothetical protein